MSDSRSEYYADEKEYTFLCEKYNEKYVDVYSNHYYWLIQKNMNNISISFEEYDKIEKIKKLSYKIKNKEEELENLRNELKKLM